MYRQVFRIFTFLFLFSGLIYGKAFAATLTYNFEMTRSTNGGTATGEMVFAAPPASPTSGWTSLNSADLLDWTFIVETLSFGTAVWTPANFLTVGSLPYDFDYLDPQSLAGDRLDDGGFSYELPQVPDAPRINFAFLSALGGDSVSINFFGLPGSSIGTYYGDWELAPVPLPAAFWLFATALAGLFGFGRRRSSQSIESRN